MTQSKINWIALVIAAATVILSAGMLLGSVATNTRDIERNAVAIAEIKANQEINNIRWARIEERLKSIDNKLGVK